jgi:general secretion pathway protein D
MRICSYFFITLFLIATTGCSLTGSMKEVLGINELTRSNAFIDGQEQISKGNYEVGLRLLEQATHEEPDNRKFRIIYLRQTETVIGNLLSAADGMRLTGNLDYSEQQYNRILDIAPQNQRAKEGLEALSLERMHIEKIEYAQALLDRNDLIRAEKIVREVLQKNPMQKNARELIKQINAQMVYSENTSLTLREAFKKPLTIEFKDIDIGSVFKVMSQTVGINFVFDKDMKKDAKVNIFVQDNSMEDILKLLTVTNHLAYKTLNSNTLLIYPDTPTKKKEYQELIVRSFYIAHTEVKQMVAMVRGLVKAKDIYVNEKLNLFIMRGTTEEVSLVARLVALNDLPQPEVMLEVEIIEVNRDSEILVGPDLPQSITYSGVAAAAGAAAFPGLVPLSAIGFGLKHWNIDNQTIIDFKKTLAHGDLLANPRIRVRNREVAKILIGERVPVVTSNVTGTAATVTQNVEYIDVGLKLDVQPVISLNNEVAIKIAFEVSTIVSFIPTGTSRVPQVGTRTVETLLSLKDGETEVLAGLINEAETKSFSGLVGLIDLPILGKLFTSQNLVDNKSEIILLITPRIIRNITHHTKQANEIHFGTANSAGRLPIKIGKTAEQSVALSSNNGSSGKRSTSPNRAQVKPNLASRPELTKPRLLLAVPKNIALVQEFSIRASLVGAKSSVAGEFELNFDTNMLQLVGTDEESGSTHRLKLGKGSSGRTQLVRFKAIPSSSGTTEITVNNISAEDKDSGESIEIGLPKATTINIQ